MSRSDKPTPCGRSLCSEKWHGGFAGLQQRSQAVQPAADSSQSASWHLRARPVWREKGRCDHENTQPEALKTPLLFAHCALAVTRPMAARRLGPSRWASLQTFALASSRPQPSFSSIMVKEAALKIREGVFCTECSAIPKTRHQVSKHIYGAVI